MAMQDEAIYSDAEFSIVASWTVSVKCYCMCVMYCAYCAELPIVYNCLCVFLALFVVL